MADQDKRGREVQEGIALLTARRLAARLTGARLCFGKPVRNGSRTIVPVARVHSAGGMGIGRSGQQTPNPDGADSGGGGGGVLDARPVGFIEIGPDGTSFRAIPAHPVRDAVGRAALLGLAGWAGLRVLGAPTPALALPRALRGRPRSARRPGPVQRARGAKRRRAAAARWPRRSRRR